MAPTGSRILLKLSGEMLGGADGRGLAGEAIAAVCDEIAEAVALGTQLALVVGAGNLVRGAGPNRHPLPVRQQQLDTMGMLATAINCSALTDSLCSRGIDALHMTTFPAIPFSQPVDSSAAMEWLSAGGVVLFSGGTGLPFFSTDTGAVVRALQVEAEALFKGTQVDGIFDRNPKTAAGQAVLLPRLTHAQALSMQLGFMDLAALALSGQHRLPITVFNAHGKGNLAKVLTGQLPASRVEPDQQGSVKEQADRTSDVEAPCRQGATTRHSGAMSRRSNDADGDASASESIGVFPDEPKGGTP